MNSNLDRIKRIDKDLIAVSKLISQGEHIAAGLRLEIGLGTNDDDPLVVDVSWDTPEILQAIHTSLTKSRSTALMWAKKDLEELKDFLGEQS